MAEQTIPERLQELLLDPKVMEFLSTLNPSPEQIKAMRANGRELMEIVDLIQTAAGVRFQLAKNACKQHKFPRGGYVCELCGYDRE